MRISDWSSDVCSSDLARASRTQPPTKRTSAPAAVRAAITARVSGAVIQGCGSIRCVALPAVMKPPRRSVRRVARHHDAVDHARRPQPCASRMAGGEVDIEKRSEEHTSEIQSLMRISYAVFCLKKKKRQH